LLTLWKPQTLPFFIMVETSSDFSSPFHQWHRPAPPIHVITALQVGRFLSQLLMHSQTEVYAQFWVRLWKSQTLPSFIMVETSGDFSSPFHQWHRPTPPIHVITALQVGRFLPQLLIHSQTEAYAQFWVHLWKSQTLPSFI